MKTLNTYFNLISIGGVLNILISKNNFIVLYYFFLVNFSQYFEKCEKNLPLTPHAAIGLPFS